MALRHLARAGVTAASASRVAPASFATSSRIGLDFTLPRREFSSSPALGASTGPPNAQLNKRKDGDALRWAPVLPEKYAGDGRAMSSFRMPTHVLSVQITKRNTYLTLSDFYGPLFASISSGTGNVFKKSKRGDYEAAHQAALKMLVKIHETATAFRAQSDNQTMGLVVVYKGFRGKGRDAVHTALSGPDGVSVRPLICRVEDHSPTAVGGTRRPAKRRL